MTIAAAAIGAQRVRGWRPSLLTGNVPSLDLDPEDRGITVAGSLVSAWKGATAAGAARPTLVANVLNGHKIVRFDGVANVMTLPSATLAAFTIVMVHTIDAKPAFAGPIAMSGFGVAAFQIVSDSATNAYRGRLLGWTGAAETGLGSDNATIAVPAAAKLHIWTSTPAYRINAAARSLGVAGTGFTHSSTLGKSHDFFKMDLARMWVFSRVLTATELARIETYCQKRWALF